MSSPSPPTPPDPNATAAAASAQNRQTAITQYGLNATNQRTPYGNLTYNQIGTWADGTPRFESTQTLSPEEQNLYTQSTANQQQLGQIGGQQIGRVGNILSTPFDVNSAANNQQFDMYRKLLDPVWQQRQGQFDTQMANQGLVPGTAAYDAASRDFGTQRDNAYTSAGLQSRGQAVSEALSNRNQPINEITALMSGSQVQQPGFTNTPQVGVAPTDVAGITQNAFQDQSANYNAQMAQRNAMLGGVFGLAAAPLGGWAYGGFKRPAFAG